MKGERNGWLANLAVAPFKPRQAQPSDAGDNGAGPSFRKVCGLNALSKRRPKPRWPSQSNTTIAVTEAVLAADRVARGDFWIGVRLVEAALPQQPGLIGFALRRELLGDRVWTITAWESKNELRRFMELPAHQEAMKLGARALIEFRSVLLMRPESGWPLSWTDALQALDNQAATTTQKQP